MIGIINVLSALGQQTRLDVLTLLSRGPADGQTSGDLAMQAGVPANSMSTHLAILAAAGMVSARRSGRQIVYKIERKAIENAIEVLTARLINEPTEHRFSPGTSVNTLSPVTWSDRASQTFFDGSISARWPGTVTFRGTTGVRAP